MPPKIKPARPEIVIILTAPDDDPLSLVDDHRR